MEKPSSINYEKLWKVVIRPNRDIYPENDLEFPEKFDLKGNNKRTDFTCTEHKKNYKLGFMLTCGSLFMKKTFQQEKIK